MACSSLFLPVWFLEAEGGSGVIHRRQSECQVQVVYEIRAWHMVKLMEWLPPKYWDMSAEYSRTELLSQHPRMVQMIQASPSQQELDWGGGASGQSPVLAVRAKNPGLLLYTRLHSEVPLFKLLKPKPGSLCPILSQKIKCFADRDLIQ